MSGDGHDGLFQFGTGPWKTAKGIEGHEDDILGAVDASRVWQSPLDFLRAIPSGIVGGGRYDDNFGRGLHAAQCIDATVRMGITDHRYAGLQVIESYSVDRRTAIILSNPPTLIFGIGLERGVPYTAPGVQRGYLVGGVGKDVTLLDAVTGKLVEVASSCCIEWNDGASRS